MSTTSSSATREDPKRPISLLSLDAGGPQGISQLLILKDVMEKLLKNKNGASQGFVKRPCEVFDMIGGVGTGGLIAIFLAVLKMTAKDALDEFSNFASEVFKDVVRDPGKQTEKLTRAVHVILERHEIAKDAKLIPTNETAPTCKLAVPVMYRNHVGMPCILRNYTPGHEPPVDLTIAEAMLATCSTPPIFTPTKILKDFATFEYIGGDIRLSNPIREIISEAHHAFGDERTVSCLLSIGCGNLGVNAAPSDSGRSAWIDFLGRLARDSENAAHDIATQTSRLTLYYRLSVQYGLEGQQVQEWKDPETITTHTTTYLNDLDSVRLVDRCVDTIKHGDGFTTLEMLKHCGGEEVVSPPLPPLNPNYVDRKIPMEFIEKAMFDEDGRVRPGSKRIIVTGIGGCGKTQLIRKFIERYKDLFLSTFFIDGSSPDTIRRDIVRHVRSLGGVHSQKSFDESMAFLSQAINGERLLIIDNVDDPTLDIAFFLPRWQNGVVVVTSRNHSRGQLSPAGHLQLDVMTPEESAELLLRGSGKPWPPAEADRKMATSVAEELGCHPIALVQAVSYMYNTGCSPESYIRLLRSHRDRLLRDHPATSQVDMRYKTAFAAFDASYNILPLKARKLWHLLSFFRWRKFPVELVTLAASEGFSHDEYPYLAYGGNFELGKECLKEIFFTESRWDPLKLHSILATLRSHSLITTTSVDKATLLQMHPLVHEWGRLRLSEEDLRRFEAGAVRLLCCGARKDNYAMMQYLYSHVESLSFLWESLHANDAASLAFILAESGMYEKSTTLDGIAHGMVKHELGPEHLGTITASANLAVAYGQLGRYAEAAELETQVLRQRKQMLGVDHPDTIRASENLAATYHDLGRYAEAVELKAQVLRQRKQMLGADHPDTITVSESLSVTYNALGRHAEAEKLQIEALKQQKQMLGANHPNTIRVSSDLAATYYASGRYAEAEELETEVLKQRKQVLGVDHPDTIRASASLAVTYHALGRYAEAEELNTEVLKQRKQVLGADHPDTVTASANLAATYHALGRYAEAKELNTEVLKQRKQMLGPDHPDTIRASASLAATYHSLGRYAEAEEMHAEVLKKRTALFGGRHPDTIDSMLYLAQTYSVTQRQLEASSLAQKALQLALETLGDAHPIYQDISKFLASLPDEKPPRTSHGRFAPYKKRTPRK